VNISFNFEQATILLTLFKEHTPHRKRSPPLKRGFKIKSQEEPGLWLSNLGYGNSEEWFRLKRGDLDKEPGRTGSRVVGCRIWKEQK